MMLFIRYNKIILTIFIATGLITYQLKSYAQNTELISHKLTKSIKEDYYVLKNNPQVKQGRYVVMYSKTVILASGQYDHNKRVGTWHFYDYKNNTVQHYDYDKGRLLYEAPDNSTTNFKYIFDKNFTSTDLVTKPVKIGGWYYGYLPYLSIFKKPDDMTRLDLEGYPATLEILVSPGGMLADYNIKINSLTYNRTLNVKLSLFTEDERKFVPATINKVPVASTIIIPCRIKHSQLVFSALY